MTSKIPLDFHRRAEEETLAMLDALGIERTTFWAHSDGAVIAAVIGLKRRNRRAVDPRGVSLFSEEARFAKISPAIFCASRRLR